MTAAYTDGMVISVVFLAQQPIGGPGLLIIQALRSQTHHTR